MTTNITRRTHWGLLTTVLVVIFSTGLFAQSRPVPASTSASPVARDLNSTLFELMRVAPATNQDLDYLQQHGKLHWVTFWKGDKANKAHMTEALHRNLQFAVPNLIHDAQASGGSISTTFELYKDLSVVCESLDSLLPPGSHEGNRDVAALSNDLSDMNRLKDELSSYIKRTAASKENPQFLSSSGTGVKRIIVDDTVPEKPAPKKRRPANQ
jgi:hypothetical protein